MGFLLSIAGWLLLSAAVGAGAALAIASGKFRWRDHAGTERTLVSALIQSHFQTIPLGEITISEPRFPFRVRADLQRAIDRLFGAETAVSHFCGVRKEYSHEGVDLSGCLAGGEHNPAVSVPPQYEEALLHKLLNEMDGLTEEADILFILTTNRPEALEQALASRPGRVDQAIEFPLPDKEGREKLVRLYAQGVQLSDDVAQALVRKTEKVSAAFIKELMRRSVQFHLERDGDGCIQLADVENALDEMLFSGGSLNLKLLGAQGAELKERTPSNGAPVERP